MENNISLWYSFPKEYRFTTGSSLTICMCWHDNKTIYSNMEMLTPIKAGNMHTLISYILGKKSLSPARHLFSFFFGIHFFP